MWQEETAQNTWVVAASYLCMLAYISVALGRCPDLVRSRFLLGLLGIAIVLASLAAALGLLAFLGLHTTLIVWEVVPFLILAIGVDNMFIISREFDRLRRQQPSLPLDLAAARTLAEVGPSILAAAVSECGAFAAGTLTSIPALQQFCLVAAVAVAADFLLQVSHSLTHTSLATTATT
jgi:predicted RND superfamily exporter protein